VTIDEFNNKSWGAGETIRYQGVKQAVVAVDFEEKLIAVDPLGDGQLI